MTINMVQFSVPKRNFSRWAAERKLIGSDDDGGYAWHTLITGAFGQHAVRPFHVTERGDKHIVLGYSEADAKALKMEMEASALPEIAMLIADDNIASKKLPEQWEEGKQYGFTVKCRPTVRILKEGRRIEVDAFLAYPNKEIGREKVYQQWLETILKNGGAELIKFRMASFLLRKPFRPSREEKFGEDRKLKGKIGPDAQFTGVLKIVNAEKFAKLLETGVGRHRAFGNGMLLVRQGQIG